MSEETQATLETIALQYGCKYGDKLWIAVLLIKIAEGDLLIVPAPSGSS